MQNTHQVDESIIKHDLFVLHNELALRDVVSESDEDAGLVLTVSVGEESPEAVVISSVAVPQGHRQLLGWVLSKPVLEEANLKKIHRRLGGKQDLTVYANDR